jgi:hypothetical protein
MTGLGLFGGVQCLACSAKQHHYPIKHCTRLTHNYPGTLNHKRLNTITCNHLTSAAANSHPCKSFPAFAAANSHPCKSFLTAAAANPHPCKSFPASVAANSHP